MSTQHPLMLSLTRFQLQKTTRTEVLILFGAARLWNHSLSYQSGLLRNMGRFVWAFVILAFSAGENSTVQVVKISNSRRRSF